VILAALIGPRNLAQGLPRPSFSLIPFSSLSSGRSPQEAIGNLILFLPLGMLLPFVSERFRTLWLICSIAFALSFCLEGAQYAMNVGRLSDIDDAILNSGGATLGWLTWRIFDWSWAGRRPAGEHVAERGPAPFQ
jgi:glycopeptide antibiotics resistance protein